ncbi:MAG: hypothetical protein ILA02_06795 [Clostridia bacterium]|nr:hypothetical protein [Clostridia bacterium]
MTQKEMDVLYEKMLADFEKATQKKEHPKLSNFCYSFAYALTRILLRFFG